MLFSSNIFLFLFLPLVVLAYQVVPKKLKNTYLLLVSSFFYGWGSGWVLFLLLGSALISWAIGVWMEKADARWRLALLWAGIVFNLSLLLYFKYFNFFYENATAALAWLHVQLPPHAHILLPIGISFFTFQKITYTVEIYRRQQSALQNPIDVGTYWTLFPHLIAGPIVRYSDISHDLRDRTVTVDDFYEGIWLFCLGLSKKMLLANTLGEVADRIFNLPAKELDSPVAWLGAICYTFQIYYDFSGYSDMAIGMAKMFGFHFPENFRQPYLATSVQEFWKRWHITLTSFFRDFVYIPLGGNRKGPVRTYVNLITVFFLTGFWHGAAWSYIFWGLWHGFFMILERVFKERIRVPFQKALGWIWTMLVVMIGWIYFRTESMTNGTAYVKKMFTFVRTDPERFRYVDLGVYLQRDLIVWLVLASVFAFVPLSKFEFLYRDRPANYMARSVIALGLLLLSIVYLSSGTFNPFIYFRF